MVATHPEKRLIGYAHVSTYGQPFDSQLEQLPAAGCGRNIYREKVTGARADRRELNRMLAKLAPGDVVTVTRIDRLARSTFDLFTIVKRIVDAKAQFRSLAEPWADTGTSTGRLMLPVLGGLADVERDLIRTRTAEGRSRAKAQGKHMGRPPSLDTRPTERGQQTARAGRYARRTRPQLQCKPSHDFRTVGIKRERLLMADTVTDEQLLAELEDLLRTMPKEATIRHDIDENFGWLGRAAAIIERWSPSKGALFNESLAKFHEIMARPSHEGFREIRVLIHQARSDLRMRTIGPTNMAITQGRVFDYFDELRKVIELANEDLLFIDPYLDADFVSRYLPHVRAGVSIRLLTSDKGRLTSLLSAVELFAKQEGHTVNVRSTSGLHDRYMFIDKKNCYQSGASFKDGAKNAPTTLTQITDAFSAVLETYDKFWSAAKVER
jgi:DNA invertase Pin-like site-specific DNA recombinase